VNLEKEKVMKKMLWALAVLPFLAVAAPPPGGGPGGPPGGEGPNPEQMQKRMRLARTLGLAEALDLSDAEALKVRDTMNKFDEKRAPLQKQLWESMQVLRKAAGGDQAAVKEVDKAIKTAFDARAQIQAVDRESFQAVTKDMSPEKRAKGDMTHSVAIIDACRPWHWRDKFPPTNTPSADVARKAREKFGWLLNGKDKG